MGWFFGNSGMDAEDYNRKFGRSPASRKKGITPRNAQPRPVEPVMLGPAPKSFRSRGPAVPGKPPSSGPQGLPLQPAAPAAAPMQPQGEQSFQPITDWDLDQMDIENPQYSLPPFEEWVKTQPDYTPPRVPQDDAPATVRPASAPAPAPKPATAPGLPGVSVDVTGMNARQKHNAMKAAENHIPSSVGDYVGKDGTRSSEVLGLGDKLNKTLNQNTTNRGATRLPDGRQRVNPVGLMGGGVTDEDRALTYYNRHTGRWTEPPEQMTDEQRAARFSRSAAAAGLTEGEDGLLQGTATVDPSARRRYMNYMDKGLPVSDELLEAAGGDATALEYARIKRNERAEEMDSRQGRVEYNAAQRAMARRARMGEGVQATPRNVRAFLGDQEARRSQNLGRTGLSSVLQEEQRTRAGLADAAAEQAKADSDRLLNEAYVDVMRQGLEGPAARAAMAQKILASMGFGEGNQPTQETLDWVANLIASDEERRSKRRVDDYRQEVDAYNQGLRNKPSRNTVPARYSM